MRSVATKFLCAAAVLTLAACGSGSGDDGDTIRVRYVTDQAPTIALGKNMQWWADEVNERTDGQVEVEFYWSSSLVATDGLLDAVKNGSAEMGFLAPAYFPEQFPLFMASNLPFISDNAPARATAWKNAYEAGGPLKEEIEENGVMMMTWDPQGPTAAAYTSPVGTLDEAMESQRIRAVGFLANAYSAVGAQTVSIPFGEVYEGLERGTLDASSSVTMEAMGSVSIPEVAPHLVDVGAGTYMTFGAMANKEWFESLPEDVRDVMTEVSSEYTEHAVGTIEELEQVACEAFKEAGSVIRLSDEDVEEFRETGGSAATDAWLDLTDDSGIDRATAESFLDEHIEDTRALEEENPYQSVLGTCASN